MARLGLLPAPAWFVHPGPFFWQANRHRRVTMKGGYSVILPSIVTRDCKRARLMVHHGRPSARHQKCLARRYNRRALDQQVKRFEIEPERFEGMTLRVRRYTGWDIA